MRYGNIIVQKIMDGRKSTFRAKVGLERVPRMLHSSDYVGSVPSNLHVDASIGIATGLRLASAAAGRENVRLHVIELVIDVADPEDVMLFHGVMYATAYAAWDAYGIEWTEFDQAIEEGWHVRR